MLKPTHLSKKQKAQRKGHRGEWLAAMSLRLRGYRIIEQGFRTKLGEIDIIARKGNLIAIVEVKARGNISSAIYAVSYESQRRIANAADIWLSAQKDFADLSLRFDIVAVLPGKWPKHFPAAF